MYGLPLSGANTQHDSLSRVLLRVGLLVLFLWVIAALSVLGFTAVSEHVEAQLSVPQNLARGIVTVAAAPLDQALSSSASTLVASTRLDKGQDSSLFHKI